MPDTIPEMDINAKAVVTLASRLGDSSRPSLSPTRWHAFTANLGDAGLGLANVFDPDFDPAEIPGIDPSLADSLAELLRTAPAATVAASELQRNGIRVLTIADDEYPVALTDKLANLAPPIIYCVGNHRLLTGDGIGVVGSRNVAHAGIEAAEAIARFAVESGRTVVSGAAKGVDSAAMNAAFMSNGTVIGVLADSLTKRIRQPEILSAIDDGQTCLLTQQNPTSGFSPGAAMGRNKLIYALTETTVVVASDIESGGTWAGATEALKKGLSDVAVWRGDGQGPGNNQLIDLGGRPVVSPEDVMKVEAPNAAPEQLKLA